MYSRETRVLLRHYLEQGVRKTELARRFGVSRRTVYHWIETEQLDRELDDEAVSYRSRPPIAKKLDPYRGIIQARLQAYPRLTAERDLRGDPGSRLRRRLHADQRVCPADPPALDRGSGAAVRDARRLSRPGRLCDLQPALGPALCAGGGARLLTPVVAAILSPPDHVDPVQWVRERLSRLRRHTAGASVRSDARGGRCR